MNKVVAVTTSMGTKWEAYSQALLKHYVPEWRRVVVDGRQNWSPTGFIEHVIDCDADYIVHVDEDCFVRSRDALVRLIELLEDDPSLAAAGVPDGGIYYRDHNPAALNLFFVAFRASSLREAWKKKDKWGVLTFRPEFAAEVMKQRPELDMARVQWDEGEPYYPLFWSLLSSQRRFLYLQEELCRPRWSSKVLLPSGDLLAEHLWYLRQWFSDDIMPGHDCPNVARYRAMASEIHRTLGRGVPFLTNLSSMHFKRVYRRTLRRMLPRWRA